MTTDLDALEALRRYREAELPDAGYAYLAAALESTLAELRNVNEIGDGDVQRLAETINENLALKAELRQERERKDELEARLALAGVTVSEMLSALSRAEETIATIREFAELGVSATVGSDKSKGVHAVYSEVRRLIEYGKQKEADRG